MKYLNVNKIIKKGYGLLHNLFLWGDYYEKNIEIHTTNGFSI